MRIRILLASVLVLGLAGVLWLDRACGDGWILLGLAALACLWGMSELFGLLAGIGAPVRVLTAAGALALLGAARSSAAAAGLVFVALAVVLLLVALTRPAPADGVREIGAALFALVYLGVFPAVLILLRRRADGWEIVVGLLACVKAGDIGAYFTGRFLGRYRLAPRLSPRKTVEGLAGGLTLAAATGALLLGPAFGVAALGGARGGLVFGLAAGAAGALGDLVESMLKRAAQTKDSGGVLPGFGGILDLIDSPLLAAPVVSLGVLWLC
ncbi:MAG: phosphatidate cytidylyltransferase [Planctomycetes bacterium]|nr:phosphatidate cytidylyltransferase [Planctomycetota bacterium]